MKEGVSKTISTLHISLLLSFIVILIVSAIHPKDLFTWFLEVFPALIGLVILALTYNRFRFTNLVYILIWIHAVILVIGGHYTYAEMPLFNWLQDTFNLARNNYDRLGHFTQGFVPSIIAREILLRRTPLKAGKLLFFMVICICLAISATYELLEWGVSEATGTAAEAFLGTQGDIWDTQWDMFLALIGGIIGQLSLQRLHDKYLKDVE